MIRALPRVSSARLESSKSDGVRSLKGTWMRAYWAGWTAVNLVIGGFSAAVTLLRIPVEGVVGIVSLSALVSGVSDHMTQQARSRPVRMSHSVIVGMVGAAGGLAFVGLLVFLGSGAFVVALLLLIGSPPAVRRYAVAVQAMSRLVNSQRLQHPPASAGHLPDATERPVTVAMAPQALSDSELCLAWRISFTALQRSRDIAQQLRLVESRQEYLDELERRDRRGFVRWLTAGARPASDPSRYVKTATGLSQPPSSS